MFNKIIDKTKIIELINENAAIKLANSRNEIIGSILYDYVYTTDIDHNSTIRFALEGTSIKYFLKIKLDNILMYDKKKYTLYIKAM